MTTKEFNELMARIYGAGQELDSLYCESEGEVTEQTENLEAEIYAMLQILAGDGIDDLGRTKMRIAHEIEDTKAIIKHLQAKVKRLEGFSDRINYLVGAALRLLGQDKVKGTLGYSFTQYTSDTCRADDAAIKELFQNKAVECLKANGFPEWITCKLSASISMVPEGVELPEYFTRTITETSKFGKPRSAND